LTAGVPNAANPQDLIKQQATALENLQEQLYYLYCELQEHGVSVPTVPPPQSILLQHEAAAAMAAQGLNPMGAGSHAGYASPVGRRSRAASTFGTGANSAGASFMLPSSSFPGAGNSSHGAAGLLSPVTVAIPGSSRPSMFGASGPTGGLTGLGGGSMYIPSPDHFGSGTGRTSEPGFMPPARGPSGSFSLGASALASAATGISSPAHGGSFDEPSSKEGNNKDADLDSATGIAASIPSSPAMNPRRSRPSAMPGLGLLLPSTIAASMEQVGGSNFIIPTANAATVAVPGSANAARASMMMVPQSPGGAGFFPGGSASPLRGPSSFIMNRSRVPTLNLDPQGSPGDGSASSTGRSGSFAIGLSSGDSTASGGGGGGGGITSFAPGGGATHSQLRQAMIRMRAESMPEAIEEAQEDHDDDGFDGKSSHSGSSGAVSRGRTRPNSGASSSTAAGGRPASARTKEAIANALARATRSDSQVGFGGPDDVGATRSVSPARKPPPAPPRPASMSGAEELAVGTSVSPPGSPANGAKKPPAPPPRSPSPGLKGIPPPPPRSRSPSNVGSMQQPPSSPERPRSASGRPGSANRGVTITIGNEGPAPTSAARPPALSLAVPATPGSNSTTINAPLATTAGRTARATMAGFGAPSSSSSAPSSTAQALKEAAQAQATLMAQRETFAWMAASMAAAQSALKAHLQHQQEISETVTQSLSRKLLMQAANAAQTRFARAERVEAVLSSLIEEGGPAANGEDASSSSSSSSEEEEESEDEDDGQRSKGGRSMASRRSAGAGSKKSGTGGGGGVGRRPGGLTGLRGGGGGAEASSVASGPQGGATRKPLFPAPPASAASKLMNAGAGLTAALLGNLSADTAAAVASSMIVAPTPPAGSASNSRPASRAISEQPPSTPAAIATRGAITSPSANTISKLGALPSELASKMPRSQFHLLQAASALDVALMQTTAPASGTAASRQGASRSGAVGDVFLGSSPARPMTSDGKEGDEAAPAGEGKQGEPEEPHPLSLPPKVTRKRSKSPKGKNNKQGSRSRSPESKAFPAVKEDGAGSVLQGRAGSIVSAYNGEGVMAGGKGLSRGVPMKLRQQRKVRSINSKAVTFDTEAGDDEDALSDGLLAEFGNNIYTSANTNAAVMAGKDAPADKAGGKDKGGDNDSKGCKKDGAAGKDGDGGAAPVDRIEATLRELAMDSDEEEGSDGERRKKKDVGGSKLATLLAMSRRRGGKPAEGVSTGSVLLDRLRSDDSQDPAISDFYGKRLALLQESPRRRKR
jgi:hypothetical protein